MVVRPRAELALDSGAVTLSVETGATDSVERVLAVTNAGDAGSTLRTLSVGSIGYHAGPEGWLEALLSDTDAPASLTLRARAGTLAAGTYLATVWLQSSAKGAFGTPRRLDVHLVVTERPMIALARTSVALAADSGSAAAGDSVAITNGGTGTLDGLAVGPVAYAAGEPTGWLTATLSATTAPAALVLVPASTDLAPGTYSATVPVTADDAPARAVTVTYTVNAAPGIVQLSADTVTMTLVAGGLARSATVTVTNATGRALTALAAQATYEGGATGWLTATLRATASPTALDLGASPGALPQGAHVARVTVSSGTATPATVTVVVEVLDLARSGAALVNATLLDAAERARLDRLGNDDGAYDLGDYLALRIRAGVDQQ
jgi:hypothetical protein